MINLPNFSLLYFIRVEVLDRLFLVGAVLDDPAKSTTTIPHDPLVAPGWGNLAYLGAFVFIALAVTTVGIISRNFERALILALVLSIGFIGFFLMFNH